MPQPSFVQPVRAEADVQKSCARQTMPACPTQDGPWAPTTVSACGDSRLGQRQRKLRGVGGPAVTVTHISGERFGDAERDIDRGPGRDGSGPEFGARLREFAGQGAAPPRL